MDIIGCSWTNIWEISQEQIRASWQQVKNNSCTVPVPVSQPIVEKNNARKQQVLVPVVFLIFYYNAVEREENEYEMRRPKTVS